MIDTSLKRNYTGENQAAALPEPSRRRLVRLMQILRQTKAERLTSAEIGGLVGCRDTLVRRDIGLAGFRGGVSNGYDTGALLSAVERALGAGDGAAIRRCCIVGLGRLGTALLDSSIFDGSGFAVVAGFDSSVNRTEILRSTFPLYPASRLEAAVAAERIEFAILSVPDREAQSVTERLSRCGIRGIVNFTAAAFAAPEGVRVENVSPVTALLTLAAGC